MNPLFQRMISAAALTACALSALAQTLPTQVDFSSAQLLGGQADQPLRELGARAAADGLAVTVSAPGYWRERIVAALEAGAGGADIDLTYRETIVENVLVRLSGQADPQITAGPEAPPPPAAQVGPAPAMPVADTSELDRASARLKEQARQQVISEADIPSAAELLARPDAGDAAPRLVAPGGLQPSGPTERPADEPLAAADPGQQASGPDEAPRSPGAEPVAASDEERVDSPPAQPVAAAEEGPADARGAARASLSRRLNGGRPIDRELKVARLRPRDLLFTTAGVIAVVRRSGAGHGVYFLDGDPDLEQEGLRKLEAGKYQVLKRIKDRHGAGPVATAAEEPAVPLGVRGEMEARYNQGRPVESSVSPAGLLPDDVLYVGDGAIMVVRRTRIGMKRFWLEGDLDLSREELEATGKRKYRVKRVIR